MTPDDEQAISSIYPLALTHTASILRLMGHPDRLKIAEVLEHGEVSVAAIQESVHMPQPVVSQHLARLRGARVVSCRRSGSHVYYRLAEPVVGRILACVRSCASQSAWVMAGALTDFTSDPPMGDE